MCRRLYLMTALLLLPAPPCLGSAVFDAAAAVVDGLDALQGEVELWPGFDPWSIPVALFDGEQTWLFRHPSPPEGFEPSHARPDVTAFEGRHEAVTANSSAEIGGVRTATLLLDSMEEKDTPLQRRVGILAHEAFHVFQREHHPAWQGNEAALFLYPTDAPEGLAGRRLEEIALRRALDAEERDAQACWARAALAARRGRFDALDEDLVAYERGTELNEGLATYVELRSRGDAEGTRLFAEPSEADQVRRRAYETGAALALLLDRVDEGWRPRLDAADDQVLDELLTVAVGEGVLCRLKATEEAKVAEGAGRDATAVVADRERQAGEFKARDGWRIVVVAPAQPLMLHGFDPLNVVSLGSGEVLHTRFLRLGNDAGELEVIGLHSLSTAAGPHPVFNGVRVLTMTGLDEPAVTDSGGRVTISTDGFTADFAATLARTGETLELRLTGE